MPAGSSTTFEKYGLQWPAGTNPLAIEFFMLRNGGFWRNKREEKEYGLGMFEHYKAAMMLLWPEDDWHRWCDLAIREFVNNTVTCLLGPKDSAKTYTASKFGLVNYFCWPKETCVLVSSTDVRGLELRVWGAMKGLYNRATDAFPWLPGQIFESLHAITTETPPDEATGKKKGKVLNRGIICIPCLQGGQYVGLGKYIGIKSKRLVFIADECQAMGPTFLSAVSNLGGKEFFRFIPIGNPNDPGDPLGQAAEPEIGWGAMPEPKKTTVWKNRFLNGKTVNFVGTDSPNFDFPESQKPRYPYLIHKGKIDEVLSFWGPDSAEYYSQCVGVMKTGLLARRVITPDLCRIHRANEPPEWLGTPRTMVYAVDAAYSGTGGDRCVAGYAEFGDSKDGTQIFCVHPPKIVPISVSVSMTPEDQIAEFVRQECEALGIPPENIGYDSTGRGTLGAAFARIMGSRTPQPIEFGGKPSTRPVRHDLYIQDGDHRRHKRCDEHYYDFVTELWFSARYTIECGQMRGLPEDVMKEGCSREYGRSKANKIFVESKHDPKARARMARSPDLFDWLVTALEMARQKGFKIQRAGEPTFDVRLPSDYWFERQQEYESMIKGRQLQHV
jgi:hypothetical protein